jgi:alkylation response protein AidB-like acyl-CoA dehydrogenase
MANDVTFAVTEVQRMIAGTVRRVLERENDFEARRHRLAQASPDRLALWPKFVEAGIVATLFPETSGGLGGTPRDAAVVLHEIGRFIAIEPYLAALVSGRVLIASPAALGAGAINQVLAGTRIIVLAHAETIDPYAPPSVQAHRDGDLYRLRGIKPAVRHADIADAFIVTAMISESGELGCFLVERAQESLLLTPHRLIDSASGGSLALNDSRGSLLLSGDAAELALADALAWQVAGLAAETAGMVEALIEATAEYLRTRKQFGVTIGTFQALQHRLADMYIAAREAVTATQALLDHMDHAQNEGSPGLLALTKITADRAGRKIGHEAVQMHGGMGVSDELNISHYMRRLACIRSEAGDETIHLERFRETAERAEQMLWFEESEEAAQNRAEVRDFVRQNLPAEIAKKVAIGLELTKDDYVAWEKILRAKGWFGVAWPKEYGGAGWNLERQLAFVQEAAVNYAPMIMPYGVNMVGPVLYNFGTSAQKEKYLPDILASRTWWCQGYSEPNSGSDLASLKTFAERDGDFYVINGAKMWTTQAHWADMMHCLVRTTRVGRQQEGITFLLVDMKTPGITIRPIITNDGQHHTNQTFFDDVRVPAENRVGEEGDGWKIAKFLLANERLAIADTGAKLRLLKDVKAIFSRKVSGAVAPAAVKSAFALNIADLEIQLAVLCMVERQFIAAWSEGGLRDGPEASLLKIRGTEILQHLAELALKLEGPWATVHNPKDLHLPVDTDFGDGEHASMMAHHYLYSRAWSIFGGTNEIQRNLIARYVLAQ